MDRVKNDEIPWSVPLLVSQLPETGLHRQIEADAAQRRAMASLGELKDISCARATFDLMHLGDQIHVTGNVSARIVQTCVVTLEPVDNAIDEVIDVMFAPPAQIASLKPNAGGRDDDALMPDPPEPIVNGTIDLGLLAMDFLFLAIDPYPRKPGVSFDAPTVPKDPRDHPFAALKALKDTPPGKKPGKA